jgi:hypothetical protein
VKRRLEDVTRILEHAGLHDIAVEASRRLDDPVDQRDLDAFLQPYGITRDLLVSLMGGSP